MLRSLLALMLILSAAPALADPGDPAPGDPNPGPLRDMQVRRQERLEHMDQARQDVVPVGDASREDLRASQDRADRLETLQRGPGPVLDRQERRENLGRTPPERRRAVDRNWEDSRRGRERPAGDRGGDWRGYDRRGADSVSTWRGPQRTGIGGPTVTQAWRNGWRRNDRYNWQDYRQRHRSQFRLGLYVDPFGWNYRRIGLGWNLAQPYYASRYWLADPWDYRLPPAPPGFRWVRYHDDAVLVDLYSGRVVDVIYDLFW